MCQCALPDHHVSWCGVLSAHFPTCLVFCVAAINAKLFQKWSSSAPPLGEHVHRTLLAQPFCIRVVITLIPWVFHVPSLNGNLLPLSFVWRSTPSPPLFSQPSHSCLEHKPVTHTTTTTTTLLFHHSSLLHPVNVPCEHNSHRIVMPCPYSLTIMKSCLKLSTRRIDHVIRLSQPTNSSNPPTPAFSHCPPDLSFGPSNNTMPTSQLSLVHH